MKKYNFIDIYCTGSTKDGPPEEVLRENGGKQGGCGKKWDLIKGEIIRPSAAAEEKLGQSGGKGAA